MLKKLSLVFALLACTLAAGCRSKVAPANNHCPCVCKDCTGLADCPCKCCDCVCRGNCCNHKV